jgi:transposase
MTSLPPGDEFALFVAFDWASQKHDVAVLDREGKCQSLTIEHSTEAIESLLSQLQNAAGGRPIASILEQSRGHLVNCLMFREQIYLFPINPQQFADYRNSFRPARASNDASDAKLLARFLFERHRDLKYFRPNDADTRQLMILTASRRKWIGQRTRTDQQLLDLLKSYFPVLLELQPNKLYQSPLTLELLTRWPTPQKLRRAHPENLRKCLAKHGIRQTVRQDELIQRLRSAPIHARDQIYTEVSAIEAVGFVAMIHQAQKVIEELDRQIATIMKRHADAPLFTSIDGCGNAMGPRLISAFGSERDRFKDAQSVANYVGVAPVTKESGKTRHVNRRYACNRFLLQTFHEFAASTARWSKWAKAYYQMQRSRGMKHHATIRKLAYCWIRILYRVWLTRTPFDEARYIESIRQKNPRIIPFLDAQKITA